MDKESGPQPRSRSQQKRDVLALQKLGERLLALASDQMEKLDIPIELKEAVRFAKSLKKHGARRRQLQYIGVLMREIDPEPIQTMLDVLSRGYHMRTETLRRAERWRDALCTGDDALLERILNRFPTADHSRLRRLVRNARSELAANQAPKSARSLFRYLRGLLEETET